MPEPTSAATATIVAGSAAVPVLVAASAAAPVIEVFGIAIGLRADVLLAGFAGAIAAITLLNSVPATGDTWRELVRTSFRRIGVAIGSAGTAGYIAPLLGFVNGVPDWLVLSVAFVAGAGAPQFLPWLITRLKGGAANLQQEGQQQ
ncbi:MAG TPA: hypothetical protein VEB23_15765 [Ramlibacter sp.]|nr:hypothetical protein [Ramlibacter sp.]